jgi:cell division protein FtsB
MKVTGKKKFRIRHLVVIFFLLYCLYTLITQQLKMVSLTRQEVELRERIKAALEEREDLKRQIQLLHTDSFIEGIARDELGLVKPGEIIYKNAEKRPK